MRYNFVEMQIDLLRTYVLRLARTGSHISAVEMDVMYEQIETCTNLKNLMAADRSREELEFLLEVLSELTP